MSQSLAAIHSASNQKDFLNIPGWGLRDAIISTDINMNIVSANKNAWKILGYAREDLIRINLKDILSTEMPSWSNASFESPVGSRS